MDKYIRQIFLIDADSKIPNLALMKLSAYHKSIGDNVILHRLNMPYYPNKKKRAYDVPVYAYDKTYCSVIFEGNKDFIRGDGIVFGGTGACLRTKLQDEIENMEPDYSIYPDNNMSYGFISRGCIRKCTFCKVPEKEGMIHQVSTPEQIVKHKKVTFLDNNILALPGHEKILKDIVNMGIKCDFNQGLDIRLLTEENSMLLFKLDYIGEYVFAFDDWKYRNIIDEKLRLLNWRRDWGLKFFVYCDPKKSISEIVNRIEFLKERKCLPYIMRDISCWKDTKNEFYVDVAAWCNQPGFFKNMSFDQFLNTRHPKNKNRVDKSFKIYNSKKT